MRQYSTTEQDWLRSLVHTVHSPALLYEAERFLRRVVGRAPSLKDLTLFVLSVESEWSREVERQFWPTAESLEWSRRWTALRRRMQALEPELAARGFPAPPTSRS